MPAIKHAIIAAAGIGSRLGLGKTKCLLEINNVPLIGYLLKLLDDIDDIRIIVGFQEHEVMQTVLRYRRDVTFVRNPEYMSTSTLTSYWLGSQGINDYCLFMDADIIFDPDSFAHFKATCIDSPMDNILAVTSSKTNDAVFIEMQRGLVTSFSRSNKTDYEWANLCFIQPKLLTKVGDSVYQQLSKYLPLKACEIVSYEIDTKYDMEIALKSSVIDEYRF